MQQKVINQFDLTLCNKMMKLLILWLLLLHVVSFKVLGPTRLLSAVGRTFTMDMDWKVTKKFTEDKMIKSVESLQIQFNTLRAGSASPSMLDRVMVDYFGSMTPLNQLARVGTSGSQQLTVEPFDKSTLKEIEKAIVVAGLNLTPNNDGIVIRINLPPLTEERRMDLTKQAKAICEDSKVAIRNIRREIVDKIKVSEKDKEISKDDSKGFQVSLN